MWARQVEDEDEGESREDSRRDGGGQERSEEGTTAEFPQMTDIFHLGRGRSSAGINNSL